MAEKVCFNGSWDRDSVCVHITHSVIGISHLVFKCILFSIVKYAGAAYLIYLGVTGLVSSKLDLD